jgi:hypothetical protein
MFTKLSPKGSPGKIHTPAIANCEPITPHTRDQLEFDWTTPPKSPVHDCAHKAAKTSSRAVPKAGGAK